MLSLELKKLLIEPKNNLWDAIGESKDVEVEDDPEILSDREERMIYYDEIVLYSNMITSDNKIIETHIEISFEKTDKEFIKEFINYKENFSISNYTNDLTSKTIYNLPECKCIAYYLNEKINKTFKLLESKNYIEI